MITYRKSDIPEHLQQYFQPAELGLEKTPEEYVAKMVEIFRGVRRVLRKDGTLWLNLGDSYCMSSIRGGSKPFSGNVGGHKGYEKGSVKLGSRIIPIGLKPKDLCGIPWRVAFALQQPYYTGRVKKEVDRAWLASMIDGEGCMFIHKRKAGQSNGQGYVRKNDTYSAGLEVANTHMAIIQRCQEITGTGSICTVERETRYKKRNIPLHRWNMRSNQCREIVREIYPYLVGKQHEARLLLGCPSSGRDAEKAHASLMALHNGRDACIDFKPPDSMYEQGYYLRQDLIWKKPNPMPESVTDRCTKAHEYIFLLTKSGRYYYDADAVRVKGPGSKTWGAKHNQNDPYEKQYGNRVKVVDNPLGANKRSVWTCTTKPFPEAHFATFPPALIEPCVLAGCPEGGNVLDPFFGSGTTGLVACKHNRRFTGIELNPEYCEMAAKRIENETKQLKLF